MELNCAILTPQFQPLDNYGWDSEALAAIVNFGEPCIFNNYPENMTSYQRLLAIVAVITMTSCGADKGSNLLEEEAKIKQLFPNLVQRFMDTRNPDDYFESVTDDYVIMGCDFNPLTAMDSIKLEIKKLAESDVMMGIEDFQTHEIIISEDLAIHRYSCVEVINSKTDTTRQRFGFNYLDILKKTSDNKWKIHLHLATAKP